MRFCSATVSFSFSSTTSASTLTDPLLFEQPVEGGMRASRPCKIRLSALRGQKHDAGHRASRHACGYVSPLAVLVGAHGNARSLSERFNAFSAYKLRSIRAQKSGLMRPQAMARSSHRRLNPAAHSTVCSASPVAPTNQHRFIR